VNRESALWAFDAKAGGEHGASALKVRERRAQPTNARIGRLLRRQERRLEIR
jgi:hypothetical protein